MSVPLAAFARSVAAAFDETEAFEAVEEIHGPGLKIQASIRRIGARQIHVDYTTYDCSWLTLEEVLHGQVEFVGDELCDLQLRFESRFTWVYEPSSRTAIRKPGRQLFEPIPGLSVLGELSFMETMARDFLLRDLGEQPCEGSTVRRIALKPKSPYRSHLLSVVTFPVRRVTVDFDTKTRFPVRIDFVPAPESPAASLVGSQDTITITYSNVRRLDPEIEGASFEPPEDARVFVESRVPISDLDESVPFPMSLAPIRERGFTANGSSAHLTVDNDHQRGYARFDVSANESKEGNSPARLAVLFGNYVSRSMARRRATFSEAGYPASSDSSVRLMARSALWEERLPGIETKHAPVEAFFEHGGVFWFLSATGLDMDSMEAMARELLEAQSDSRDAPAGPDKPTA
jgi:hypothetical protein